MTNEKFKALVEQHERLVFTICYQLVQDYHEAQNLAQETFVSAFTHIDSVSEQNLRAWLGRVAANKNKNFFHSAHKKRTFSRARITSASPSRRI